MLERPPSISFDAPTGSVRRLQIIETLMPVSTTATRAEPTHVVRWLDANDVRAWDEFVRHHPLGLTYHTSSWQRVLEDAFPHIRGRVLALCDSETGKIRAGMPIYAVKSWILGHRLVSIPFASFCDPLLTDASDLVQLTRKLQGVRVDVSARRIEIRTRKATASMADLGFARTSTYKHHLLDIDRDPDTLFRSFAKSSVCQKIGKAQRAGVTVVEGERVEDLRICHEILANTRRRLSLPPMPIRLLTAFRKHLWPEHMKMLIAYQGSAPVGCHVLLVSDDLWISEYSGNVEGALHGVNQLLYWEAIRRAQLAGAKHFSFGRTAASNTGLLEYKRRWGTLEEDLVEFVSPSPAESTADATSKSREQTLAYRGLKRLLSKAPMPVCNAIGAFCYRHLG